ncbi:hypothetical protein VNI00_015729 [Paramarasmius palmivorus]|uniref:Uncharacterized protein n=1 Tax=Paramarasmius palmivorus TaxID=297713 RepID=A0AAW0BI99_9AGAR
MPNHRNVQPGICEIRPMKTYLRTPTWKEWKSMSTMTLMAVASFLSLFYQLQKLYLAAFSPLAGDAADANGEKRKMRKVKYANEEPRRNRSRRIHSISKAALVRVALEEANGGVKRHFIDVPVESGGVKEGKQVAKVKTD